MSDIDLFGEVPEQPPVLCKCGMLITEYTKGVGVVKINKVCEKFEEVDDGMSDNCLTCGHDEDCHG